MTIDNSQSSHTAEYELARQSQLSLSTHRIPVRTYGIVSNVSSSDVAARNGPTRLLTQSYRNHGKTGDWTHPIATVPQGFGTVCDAHVY
jgi:hypothetical protein